MDLDILLKEAKEAINAATSEGDLEELRIKYFGRKQGIITDLLRTLKDMDLDAKRTQGPVFQAIKTEIETLIDGRLKHVSKKGFSGDPSLPGREVISGRLHILTKVEEDVMKIFRSMNFSVADGPEIEIEHYNFDALNIPADHPARDMWDTFWLKSDGVKDRYLLRTHTSPVQVRYAEAHKPPFQIICPGRTFRYEATDATHEINFYQVEGLMVGEDVSLANFKYIMEEFFKRLFEVKEAKVRFRSSYFPFVEPGVEMDVKLESGKWLEMGGAGMVHPYVLKQAGIDPKKWQGFAFGMGLERLAMVKYGITDIRNFMSGDLRFIKQF